MQKRLLGIVLSFLVLALILTGPIKQKAFAASEKIKWVGQAHVPNTVPFFKYLKRIADRVTAASEGKLELAVYPVGAIVPPTKEFDGVNKGTIDFGMGGFTFWVDKFPAAGLFAQVCGDITPMQKYLWYTNGGGYELLQKMVKDYDVLFLPGSGLINPAEVFLQTTTPIKSLSDLKKMKIRAVGDGASILSKLGVSIVFMGAQQLYESTSRNVIDGFELGNLADIYDGKYYEVIKYIYTSPIRSPHEIIPIFFNKKKFNALPDNLKIIVESITKEEAYNFYADTLFLQVQLADELKKTGVVIEKIPADIEAAFKDETKKYYIELAEKDALAKEVLESLNATIAMLKQVQPDGQ